MPRTFLCLRVLCAFLLTAIAPAALAHAHLVSSAPAANALVQGSPQQLVLTFTEGVEPRFSRIRLVGPLQVTVPSAALSSENGDNTHLRVPLDKALPAGDYQVAWKVVSVDGHRTQGTYRFTVK
jgi:methionine-rich copper-binding protein CopC